MNADQIAFHNLREKLGLLDEQQTAWSTGLREDELMTVAKAGVLRPLAWPLPTNAKRLWSRSAVERFNGDEAKQEAARRALLKFHRDKNNTRLGTAEKRLEAVCGGAGRDGEGDKGKGGAGKGDRGGGGRFFCAHDGSSAGRNH